VPLEQQYAAAKNVQAIFNSSYESSHTPVICHTPGPVIFDSVTMERDLKPMRKGAKMEIMEEPVETKVKPGACFYGIGSPTHLPTVAADNLLNEIPAIRNRSIQEVPTPDPEYWRQLGEWVHKYFDDIFPNNHTINPSSFAEWNERFPANRQKAQVKALFDYQKFGLDHFKDTIRKTFLKREKGGGSGVGSFESYDTRVIQGTTHIANVLLGPWMHAFNKYLKEAWSTEHFITYSGGLTGNELGAWFDKFKYVFDFILEDDFSRFDGTISQTALDLEFSIYKRLGISGDALTVLYQQKTTHGYTKNGIKYYVPGTRKSGDPNTSNGNSLINGLTHLFNLCMKIAVMLSIHIMDLRPSTDICRALVQGDDNLTLTSVPIAPEEMQNSMLKLGFNAKTLFRECLYTSEFCNARFWPSTKGCILSSKPGRLLKRLFYSVGEQKDWLGWVRGVAIGHYANTKHVPFSRVLIKRVLELTDGVRPQKIYEPYKLHVSEVGEVVPESWVAIFSIYGLTESDEAEFEVLLKSVTSLPCFIDHPIMDTLIEIDN